MKLQKITIKLKIANNIFFNNIHTNISACSVAESTSINPKQCRKLKLSAKSWNWVQKVEIKLIDRKVGKRAKTKWRPMLECLREQKSSNNITIHETFDQFNERYKYINQSTRNWTYVQHKRGFTKLLKATNRGFTYATARKEERLQAWIEVGHFSQYQYNWIRIKAPDNAWQRALKFPSGIWILQSPATPLCLRTNRKGKPLRTRFVCHPLQVKFLYVYY